MRNFMGLLVGGLFGAGLFTSGMTDTNKVQGWLDLFGAWDPTLAFVLSGAIAPMAIAWRAAARRRVAVLGNDLPGSPNSELGINLIVGSTLFGAGWALAGLCPGPAVASLSYGGFGGVAFLAAMFGGFLLSPFVKSFVENIGRAVSNAESIRQNKKSENW